MNGVSSETRMSAAFAASQNSLFARPDERYPTARSVAVADVADCNLISDRSFGNSKRVLTNDALCGGEVQSSFPRVPALQKTAISESLGKMHPDVGKTGSQPWQI